MSEAADHEGLIRALAADLRPVRRLLPPWVRALCWLGVVAALGAALASIADLSALRQRLGAAPDMWLAALGSTLTALLAVPSVGGTDAEADVQHVLAKQLTRLGLDVDLWAMDLPALAADPAFPGAEVTRAEAWGLVGSAAGADAGKRSRPPSAAGADASQAYGR